MGEQNWTARSEFSELPIPSIARRVQEDSEVAEGVRAVVDEHRQAALRVLSRVMLFGLVPILAVTLYRHLSGGAGGVFLWALTLGLVLVTIGAAMESLPLRRRGQIVTYTMMCVGLLAVAHFGPLLSVGFAFVASVFLATLLLGAGHGYLVATGLSLGLCVFAALSFQGAELFAPELEPSFDQWVRTSAATCVGLYFFCSVFIRLQEGLSNSVGQQIRLRLRERRFEEEREKMVRSAGSVQRLESLGRLAGGIAHDFNNSLVVIQCGVGALEDDLSADERREILSEVNEGVNRAASTARQLLSFAKRNVEEIGVCDPHLVADRLVKEATRLLPANVSMSLSVPDPARVPAVSLSESAVEQILLTLIANAREALGDDAGRVTLSLKENTKSGGLLLEVKDTGPGIPPEIRDQVWEPFFTTKGEEHMGLGLSTLWATVRRHGGSIDLSSEVGVGTTISMTFPPASLDRKEPKKRRREGSAARPVVRTVLVLEDEAPIRTALRRVLKHSGLEVIEAATVQEARDALGSRQFALLISDGVLPDGGVGKFIRDFREKQRAPVILCSGYLEEDLALEGISKGECSFLPKPFSPEDLTELVESLLARDRISSD